MRRVATAVSAFGIVAAAALALASCKKNPGPPPNAAQTYGQVTGGPHALPTAAAAPADDGN